MIDFRGIIAAIITAATFAGAQHAPATAPPTAAATQTASTTSWPTLGPRPGAPGTPTIWSLMPLGDSITAGTAGTNSGYRGYLDALAGPHVWVGTQLDDRGLLHEGHPGWTIDQIADQATAWTALTQPAIVLLHAGTNDDGQDHTSAQMLASMARLLDAIAAGSPGSIVIVAQIPLTPHNTPEQQAQEAAFNSGLPALVAGRQRVRVIDLSEAEISADGVHPDDAGYAWMAQRWAAALPAVRIS